MSRYLLQKVKACGFAVLGAGLLAAPVGAQAPELQMLDGLAKGSWSLRIRDGGTKPLCLRDGRELLQLQHTERGCRRVVLNDNVGSVTVQYTCPGNGYGRTTVRRESQRLVQIQTQGIQD